MTPQYNQTGEMTLNAKHTPGAEVVLLSNLRTAVFNRETVEIAGGEFTHKELKQALSRISACVNALEGVTTEELESGAFKAELAFIRKQNDELLDECYAALSFIEDDSRSPRRRAVVLESLRAVLTGAKGA